MQSSFHMGTPTNSNSHSLAQTSATLTSNYHQGIATKIQMSLSAAVDCA